MVFFEEINGEMHVFIFNVLRVTCLGSETVAI